MKNLIKLIIVSLSLFIFSTPVLASEYAHTIEYILFQGYKEYGVSTTVTTNIDTEEDATLYLAVYSEEGVLLESVSEPLDQIIEGERNVHKLKISTVLDETMTVKAFVWKDMMPVALPLSIEYDNKFDSGTITVEPETKDYIYIPSDDIINADDIEGEILDKLIPTVKPDVDAYPVTGSTSEIDVSPNGEFVGEPYDGIYSERNPFENINIYLDEHGKLISNNN